MKQPIKSLLLSTAAAALVLASSTSFAAGSCTNDTWNKVMSSGKLTVGVKAD
jgi:polar amino acid transport system substrate-binding protein